MKVISAEQNLCAVSGGSTTGYDLITGTSAFVGGGLGGFVGFAVAVSSRTPNILAIVAMPVAGGFVGAASGYAVGAVAYTIGGNIGTILSAPFKLINFVFRPNS